MTQAQAPVVENFDHHSPEFRERPHQILAEMRSRCPVARSTAYGGFWALVDYQSVFDAARDDDLFNSYPTNGIPPSGAPYPILPIETDPPLTQKLRAITIKAFSPGQAERLRPRVRRMARAMINEFIERGHCDIVGELTTPLPAKLVLHMLGFDESKYLQWVQWVHSMVHDRTHDPETSGAAVAELFGEIFKHMAERRESGDLGDDLFGRILNGRIDDQPLDDTQILMYTVLMMLGGMDTTSGLTGNVLHALTQQPELREQLIANPALIHDATDEFLRLYTPTLGLARTISRDAEFHGAQLNKGDRCILMWAAANRDPAIFEDPDTFDLNRPNSRKQMAFGVGIHRCLGSHIARMMFQEMLTEVLQRIPDYRLDGEPVRFEDAGEVWAIRKLPIAFTPGPRLPVEGDV
ncbi:cytochrome P450 family protein [Mycolicibacterium hassiacum DSM 44199]|uniref:Cytochrome P450 family protein n=1 Tax=Mycolicibacterium hassiacum (strain DSM 44199 / CIP 105218 / JCM 12690 / 3849) TaxID=1122247 RepID=K5BCM2_MYCHD|nr:cytochrome P450 [Mycolicibacterium hassiacum]EKF21672.1 cytochrome P450 family protein [Mycolicibacterium hassiacum DSM 44199]MDA4084238.1 cytochrome P450 [Mycolicibacterium hassiacum DSM 44199]PZN25072.1 MAG: cytochrome P450 [Mycolicibacterium hassiacum]VCT91247.1 Steroid C26-monooxygenase [Mycolicibacterium hassiacum DSM 44199]